MKKHCEVGTHQHTVPMPINGRSRNIDRCIADLVAALNAANVQTVASCCGHGNDDNAYILLEDGRVLQVYDSVDSWELREVRDDADLSTILIDDQPCTPMPKICTIFGCGGTIFDSGGFMVCENCGRSYGESR